MSTKERVLDILKNNTNIFISGQEMADRLFVTRASVWKAIKSIEKDGQKIEAVTNKGYRLIINDVAPSEILIRKELESISSAYKNADIDIYDVLDSTNDKAKEFGLELNEKIIIANKQTKGRGRRGRSFYSPEGTGIYLSFLLYPNQSVIKAISLTCMMAECVRRSIKEVTDLDTSIKWVNDIYYNDKKIAGILTEGITSIEDGSLEYVIIGVGINLYMPTEGFPKEIKDIATSLLSSLDDGSIKNKLIAHIIDNFYKCYKTPSEYPFLEDYKNNSFLIGKYVKILTHSSVMLAPSRQYAYVTGIDDECHLLIRYDDGYEESLYSGEVSVVKY